MSVTTRFNLSLAAFFLLSMADMGLTIYAIGDLPQYELNPLMRMALESGVGTFAAVKVILSALAVLLLWQTGRHPEGPSRATQIVVYWCCGFYCLVVLSSILQLLGVG